MDKKRIAELEAALEREAMFNNTLVEKLGGRIAELTAALKVAEDALHGFDHEKHIEALAMIEELKL